jgi:hypothetical protein
MSLSNSLKKENSQKERWHKDDKESIDDE